MAFETTGVLKRKTTGNNVDWSLSWAGANGKPQPQFGRNQIYPLLSSKPEFHAFSAGEALVTFNVKIAVQYGKLLSIEPADDGMAEQMAAAAAAKQAQEEADAKRRSDEKEREKAAKGQPYAEPASWNRNGAGHFHNPYNFVPSPEGVPQTGNPLSHDAPKGHHAYLQDLYSGTLNVTLKVKTPLVIMDTAAKYLAKGTTDHWVYPVLKGRDGKPVIPVTSLKGPLRAAYEAITNSRMGVLEKHDNRLGRRMSADDGLAMVPARISQDGQSLELWMGDRQVGGANDWENFRPKQYEQRPGQMRWRVNGTMYAAWLPSYLTGSPKANGAAPKYDGRRLPGHKDEVVCWLKKFEKLSQEKKSIFKYCRVVEIKSGNNIDTLSARAPESESTIKHREITDEKIYSSKGLCL